MGLTEWKPTFRVTVDGTDITALLAPRLISLSVTDAVGVESDAAEFSLTDTTPFAPLAEPPPGAEVRVWLGYFPRPRYMGLFIADSVSRQGPPDSMTVRAVASPQGTTTEGKTAITEQCTRSWPAGTSLGQMVARIAADHGMQAAVAPSLAQLALPHFDQIDESDINLLSRVARVYDAAAKPGDGKLVVARRGESLAVTGEALPVVELGLRDVTSWSSQLSLRAPAGSAIAIWRDTAAGKDIEEKAGDGEPVRRLRSRFANREQARAAAQTERDRSKRSERSLSLTMPGRTDIMAEGRVRLRGFRREIDTDWLITSVTHSLSDGGYQTSLQAEPPPEP